jgi:hypothetical protein
MTTRRLCKICERVEVHDNHESDTYEDDEEEGYTVRKPR